MDEAQLHDGVPRADPGRLRDAVERCAGGRYRRGALLGHLRGPTRRELRRRARHLPVGARRRRRPSSTSPLLGEPVHRQGDRLPARGGYDDDAVAMSVGVQKMVAPPPPGWPSPSTPRRRPLAGRHRRVLGVRRGRRQGIGDPRQLPGRQGPRERHPRTISDKAVEYGLGDGDRVEVAGRRGPPDAPCLTDEEVQTVARLARRSEQHYGCPQDVEWALDPDLPAPGQRGSAPEPAGDGLEPQGGRPVTTSR